ncbi:hypothetical protein BH23CHL2_BH23CHL2_08760 [soil metagenome]
MARFYLDHDIHRLLSRLIIEHGHDATTAYQEGTSRYRDSEHLLFASTIGRILLTGNRRDFLELHYAWLGWTRAWGILIGFIRESS